MIEELGNPFIDESKDFLVLDTRDIVDLSVVNANLNLQKTGKEQYDTFALNVLLLKHNLSMTQSRETKSCFLVDH